MRDLFRSIFPSFFSTISPLFLNFANSTRSTKSATATMHATTLLLAALALVRDVHSTPASANDFELSKRQFAQAAMMRFECSQLVIERIDPLAQPGQSPSTHTHQIAGGNSFNSAMEPVAYDPAAKSSCTSCTFSEDFSNYWTANLYFKARNGTFKRVLQMTNLGLRGKNGGLTVYYIPPYDGKTKVTAFKPVGPNLTLLSTHRRLLPDNGEELTCHHAGLPHDRRRPHAPLEGNNAKTALSQMFQQYGARSIRRCALHRKRH